ncbi:MAG: tRNA (N(6)-L-threonylcarbamoyladenosine(37)-C(2))-methylthiotransferase MtaB, partial [Desulfobacterales bacterium]
MLKFKFTTLGCKVNQYESDVLAVRFEAADLVPAGPGEAADLVIINTCTVTGRAAMQSRQTIRRAVRENPGARVVVMGCYAQTAPAEIERIDGVDMIVGVADKPHLPELVIDRRGPLPNRGPGLDTLPEAGPTHGPVTGNRSRPFLKIQDGCEAFCTYCIVPYARGPSRSIAPEQAIEGIRRISRAGYHEVVLTGIHLGCYGNDLTPPTNLLALLGRIRTAGAVGRVRLSSIEPREISDALIGFAAHAGQGQGRICPHFHIPLQSGDDAILKKMHRPYTGGFFAERVAKILQLMPDAAIGVDILAGFPGESDACFERTRRLIEELPVAYLHVFPFSPRTGTPAWHFPEKVPAAVVKERCHVMRDIGKQKKYAYYQKFVGRPLEVIIENRRHLPPGHVIGTSANYIPVLVKKTNRGDKSLAPLKVVVEKIAQDLRVFGQFASSNHTHRPLPGHA